MLKYRLSVIEKWYNFYTRCYVFCIAITLLRFIKTTVVKVRKNYSKILCSKQFDKSVGGFVPSSNTFVISNDND